MARQREQRLLVRVGQLVLSLPAPEAVLAPPAHVMAKPGAHPDEPGLFRHGAGTVALVDLRRRFGVPAEGGKVLLARAGAELCGFAVDEVIGPAPSWAKSAPLPPGLPARTFSGAWVYRKRMVLGSEYTALHALGEAGPGLRQLAQSVPTAQKAHVPLYEALSELSAETREAGGKRSATPKKPATAPQRSSAEASVTQPSASAPPGADTPREAPAQAASSGTAATSVPDPAAGAPDHTGSARAPAAAAPEPATRTPPARKPEAKRASTRPRAFVQPMLAAAAVIALVVVALPFMTHPKRPRPPLPVEETMPPPTAALPSGPQQVEPPGPAAKAQANGPVAPATRQAGKPPPPTVRHEPSRPDPAVPHQAIRPAPPVTRQSPAPAVPAQSRTPAAAVPRQAGKPPPEESPATTVRIEPSANGVTVVVEHPERPEGQKVRERVTVHTVRRGDTLWDIAARYLDDPFAYDRLAVDSRIENPDLIQVGDKVRIVVRERR